MILVTGAAGFIGSCLVSGLNEAGNSDLILVDEFKTFSKEANLEGKSFVQKVDREEFLENLDSYSDRLKFIFHLGARTDTTELNKEIFDRLNVAYSKALWTFAAINKIPFIYASSAATYGGGDHGYDDKSAIDPLTPLNPYGQSKQSFDLWARQEQQAPPAWAGLKFFNVYGPNEYHKGRMASVIFHAFNQIKSTGKLKLFRSHREDFEDGQQSRDFVYVKDVVKACLFFLQDSFPSGLFNIGTGKARPCYDLGLATFSAMGVDPNIEFIDTPEDIRETYQYFTEAKMEKLASAGYSESWMDLEEGVRDYVTQYLIPGKYY
ncbi:MAG: ADP-glyceromanno-heptose 6-epimerase [Saprospiraceae bacterium]|nr:ADP-glyceromanno-heptose 6-epimerase [Saprospiraceae bacterium]